MKRTAAVALILASSIIVACRGGGGGGGDDDDDVDAPTSGDIHIQDVQNDSMAAGTPVTLHGVIVTAIDTYGAKTGDFWVEEAGGGPFSGVHVFGAPLAAVSALAVGDIVDISGAQKDEFAYQGSNGSGGDMSGRSLTEVEPINGGMMVVTKTGTGTVPAPSVVDAVAIGQMADQASRDAEWEKWEGVLVTIKNVTATDSPRCVGSACSDNTNNQFGIPGHASVESSLAPLPGFMAGPPIVITSIKRGDCLGSVTGVVDYFFDYLLLNTPDGVATTGGTCATEVTHATCSDGMDNDGNGFVDCADFSCVTADPACSSATTIPAIRAATPTGAVTLENVVVTAISFNGKDFWVSTNAAASPNNGVFVFNSSVPLPAGTVVGSKVTMVGTVQEFPDPMTGPTITEFKPNSITLSSDAAVTPTGLANPSVADMQAAATDEPYESVLVTLQNVKIATVDSDAPNHISSLTQKLNGNTLTFKADDAIYRLLPAENGKCYSSITGVWNYEYHTAQFVFDPRKGAGTAVDGTLAAVQTDCD